VVEVLRENKPMRVTVQQVREIMRVIALARKGTNFPGKPKPVAAPVAEDFEHESARIHTNLHE
jgi:hypothetical protein